MNENITHLCAGCGREIPRDYWEPQITGLCAECEEKIQQADSAWKPKQEVDSGSN